MEIGWLPDRGCLSEKRLAANCFEADRRPRQARWHDVRRDDVLRRFGRSWTNFNSVYRPLADAWSVYDNSGTAARLLEQGP